MWNLEQRNAASERAKKRWADPTFKAKVGRSRSRPFNCSKCGETNPSNFYVDKKGNRTNKKCRECHKVECKNRWHSRSSLDRWASRNYKYNVTKEFLVDLYQKQGGKCAICKDFPQTARNLHVDHCHQTGAVRGLLCHGCNTGIGALRDNPEIVANALSYLKG